MIFGNKINIPNKLLHYLEQGRVVFFCGAGISMDAGLPSFAGLAKKVCSDLGIQENYPMIEDHLKQGQYEEVFQFLQCTIGKQEIDKKITEHLNTSKKSDNHQFIFDLASAYGHSPKIVTTNFDTLFDNVIRYDEIKTYVAPAVPIPNGDWSGIVHLHGRLHAQSPLIVSSGDFGNAYITHGWASKFLTELFSNNVVCFVGYSANDTIMRYMLDAIASTQQNISTKKTLPIYLIGGHKENDKKQQESIWKLKNIKYIPYKIQGENDHGDFTELLQDWSVDTKTPHRQFIKECIIKLNEQYIIGDRQGLLEKDFYKLTWLLTDPKDDFYNFKSCIMNEDIFPEWNFIDVLIRLCFDSDDLIRFGIDDPTFIEMDNKKRNSENLNVVYLT